MTTSPDYRDPSLREHFVYRLYDANDVLLYVGCSKNLKQRWTEHRSQRDWACQVVRARLSGPYNYDAARRLEREALATEEPLQACRCGAGFTGPTYEKVTDRWAEHLTGARQTVGAA